MKLCALAVLVFLGGLAVTDRAQSQSMAQPAADLAQSGIDIGPAGRSARSAEIVYYADAYADHYGVPRELVYAIITQESGWKPTVVSGMGARGLMQLMPGTAARYQVKDAFNISDNIGAGVHYLADLFAQFRDWRLAVASYYCGPRYPVKRGLAYANPDVVAYVKAVQRHYSRELVSGEIIQNTQGANP